MVLNGGIFCHPKGHLAVSGDIFGYHGWRGATGIWHAEARDAAKHLPCSTTKNFLARNFNGAKVEKLCSNIN